MNYEKLIKIMRDSLIDEDKKKLLPSNLKNNDYLGINKNGVGFSVVSIMIDHFAYWISAELENEKIIKEEIG